MSLRVCGAVEERDALSRARCWCRGFFCGRGGAQQSTRFWRAFKHRRVARSLQEFRDLVAQIPLFDDDKQREEWMAKFLPEWGKVDGQPSTRDAARSRSAVARSR